MMTVRYFLGSEENRITLLGDSKRATALVYLTTLQIAIMPVLTLSIFTPLLAAQTMLIGNICL